MSILDDAPRTPVLFSVANDDDARRISAVLDALGYAVVRDTDNVSPEDRLDWHVSELTRKHKLTGREADILGHILEGKSNSAIAVAMVLSLVTVKWHMHNIFAKTNTGSREGLLRLVRVGG